MPTSSRVPRRVLPSMLIASIRRHGSLDRHQLRPDHQDLDGFYGPVRIPPNFCGASVKDPSPAWSSSGMTNNFSLPARSLG